MSSLSSYLLNRSTESVGSSRKELNSPLTSHLDIGRRHVAHKPQLAQTHASPKPLRTQPGIPYAPSPLQHRVEASPPPPRAFSNEKEEHHVTIRSPIEDLHKSTQDLFGPTASHLDNLETQLPGHTALNRSTEWFDRSSSSTSILNESFSSPKLQVRTLHASTSFEDSLREEKPTNVLNSSGQHSSLHQSALQQSLHTSSSTTRLVSEFSSLPGKKALLVAIHSSLPGRDANIKHMYKLCEANHFDEVVILDTPHGTRKGVIMHFYKQLTTNVLSTDVRLFYMYGLGNLANHSPDVYAFVDSTKEVRISRWHFDSFLTANVTRIWDCVHLDSESDVQSVAHTAPLSTVTYDIAACTQLVDVSHASGSPLTRTLHDIHCFYAFRERPLSNKSLERQLNLAVDDGVVSPSLQTYCLKNQETRPFLTKW